METVFRVVFVYVFIWACFRTLGKRELGAERDKRAGESTAHPSQHPRTRDYVIANRSGE